MSTIALDRSATRHHVRHLSVVPDLAVPNFRAAPVLRLTRRGKAVVLTLALLVVSVLVVMFGPSTSATGHAGTPQQTTMVRVLPGHTLWQIASDANPNGDIRATVDDIVRLNSLPNASALQMGSEIAVPVYK
jgi:hypothetical protein